MIAECKRKDIPHLHQMNPYEFAHWVYGASDMWTPRVHSKLDGFYGRFGKDAAGVPFIQTARSGILRDASSIVLYALSRGYEGAALVRANDMAQMYTEILQSEFVSSMPADVAYDCEFFYKPLAQLADENTITFVTLPYKQSAFPRDLTVYIHRMCAASTGDEIEMLTPPPCADFDLRSSRLPNKTIDLFEVKDFIFTMSHADLLTLKSLKHKDRVRKLQIKEYVQTLQDHFGRYVLNHYSDECAELGSVSEGIVLHVNSKQFKVVTSCYKRFRNYDY